MGMCKHLPGGREEFDAWIRDTIGDDFRWKIRPRDTPSNWEMVADLILMDIESGGGVFPESNAFIERMRPKHGEGERKVIEALSGDG